MDQDPLPRGSSQVADRLAQVLNVGAVEAENATYITEHVIVVDVLRVGRAADGAGPALTGQEPVELLLPDPVPPPQVVLPRAAPVELAIRSAADVGTRL